MDATNLNLDIRKYTENQEIVDKNKKMSLTSKIIIAVVSILIIGAIAGVVILFATKKDDDSGSRIIIRNNQTDTDENTNSDKNTEANTDIIINTNTEKIKDNQWKKIYKSMLGLSYSDIKKIKNNLSKKAVLSNNYEQNLEKIIAEVYLFKTHGEYSKEDLAVFLLECGVPKKRIEAYTGFSRRKIDQYEERRLKIHE